MKERGKITIKTNVEIQEKINDCLLNKSRYVEWLCQNKTEKQMEKLSERIDKIYHVAVSDNMTKHIELIEIWKDTVSKALKKFSNYEHLYVILKKMRKNRKITSYERMVVDINHDWFYDRIYDLPEEDEVIMNKEVEKQTIVP